jgi:hypothetical protein
MTERDRLRAALIALIAEDALIAEAQAEVKSYLSKGIEAAELISRLISLLDGPEQRRAQRLARAALGEGLA